jgi:hypothetical protein
MNLPLINLSAEQLRRAAEIKEKIDALERELQDLLGTENELIRSRAGGRRRSMSPATIGRMRAAQRARWARIRGETAASPKPRKRKIRRSAAARARLSEIAKARWRKARAAGRTTL